MFVSLYDSFKKNISVLNTVLPKSSSDSSIAKSPKTENLSSLPSKASTPNTTSAPDNSLDSNQNVKENLSPHSSQSSKKANSSVNSDEALFPSSITINNELFKQTEFTQCSNQHTVDELAKMIRFDKDQHSNTMEFKFDLSNHMSAGIKTNEFLSTPSPSSGDNTGYGSSGSSASSLNNFGVGESDASNKARQQQQHQQQQQQLQYQQQHVVRLASASPNANVFEHELKKSNHTHLPTPPTVSSIPATIKTTTKSLTKPVSTKDKEKTYICEYCSAEFKIRGYLTRHIKKHAINKAYECPFYDETPEHKCHPNGGFSRRDTYKTHLKSRHFKYPKGTRLVNRGNLAGNCGLCNEFFTNNEDWIEHHIENGECPELPKDYQIRVKNSRNKFYEFPNLNKSNEHAIVSPVSNITDLSSNDESPANVKESQSVASYQTQAQQASNSCPPNFQQAYQNYHNQTGTFQQQSQPQRLPQQSQSQYQSQYQYQYQNEFPLSTSFTSLNSLASSQSSNTALLNSLQGQVQAPSYSSENLEEIFKHFNYANGINGANTQNKIPGANQAVDFNDEFSLDVESSANYSQFAMQQN